MPVDAGGAAAAASAAAEASAEAAAGVLCGVEIGRVADEDGAASASWNSAARRRRTAQVSLEEQVSKSTRVESSAFCIFINGAFMSSC